MRRNRIAVALGAAVATTMALVGSTTASAVPDAGVVSKTASVTSSYVVLTVKGADATAVAARLTSIGAQVVSVNSDIGVIEVKSNLTDFRGVASKLAGVRGVAANSRVGKAPQRVKGHDRVEREAQLAKVKGAHKTPHRGKPKATADPLDNQLWGMDMIQAPEAHKITMGNKHVRVGILDTGVDASHVDIAPNFDAKLSRNFVTDIPEIDGPCEVASCKDPANVDEGGHGTHVAGTIAAAMNGVGVSGVAPKADIVNIRGGQDSGYFFLGPVVNALTYAGDVGLDVVNMSFYVDPWLYNCIGGAPEDAGNADAISEQETIIEAVQRAVDYANSHGVTLLAAAGNEHTDMANPGIDATSPDYDDPTRDWDDAPYDRTIDNAKCLDMPTEARGVIGVTSVGPSGKKADYSNYTTDVFSGEVEVSAPGGWYRDGFGTDNFKVNENLILSTIPKASVIETGEVDDQGNITDVGLANGVQKVCPTRVARGVAPCSYYAFYQGTSMATPHASGVAALIVAAHSSGHKGMSPSAVQAKLMASAVDHACPVGGVQSYADEERPESFTAKCVGTAKFNGFYGDGIVNALRAVKK